MTFAENVSRTFGAAGRAWLAALPELTADLAGDWGLELGEPYRLTYHWVAPARTADGTPAVLKLGVPGEPHLADEATALEIFAGRGAVHVLRRDPLRGAILLSRADPGVTLRSLVREDDPSATRILTRVMGRLHRPAPPGVALPHLTSRLADFDGHLARHPGDEPLSRDLVVKARRVWGELCDSAPADVVLHGDLHHENVLRHGDEWLAIDPHGVIGDPLAEIGPALYNPLDGPEPVLSFVDARLDAFATLLDQPVARVTAWGFAQAVLSEVWDAQAGPHRPGTAWQVACALTARVR